MTCKTILVALDTGPRCVARVAVAARLAVVHRSRLVGVAPTGLPDVIVTMNRMVPDAVECGSLSASFLRERADALARAFEQQAGDAGVPCIEARVVEDEPLNAVVRAGRCCDLVVVGQTDPSTPVDGIAFDFPQQVVLHTGAPVLVVPFAGGFGAPGARVLGAWKDTREAARALRDALPTLRGAEQVMLVEIGDDGIAPDTLTDAQRRLADQGIAATARSVPGLANAGDALLALAAELSCDPVVMGAYGHSRLRERVLVGVTRHILDAMTVPTLMSH